MSASVIQPNIAASWKHEVSLRIARHHSLRASSTVEQPKPAQNVQDAGSRAQQAVARVAAHYAKAPSYSQLQAAEAHAARRAAEAEQMEALKSQAMLAAMKSSAALSRSSAPEALPVRVAAPLPVAVQEVERASAHSTAERALPATLEAWENEHPHILWEPELSLRPVQPLSTRTQQSAEEPAYSVVHLPERPALAEKVWERVELEPVEPDQPIHANLIEFPRELVAARKMRPLRVEGSFAAADKEQQLSIFEVAPGAISTQPEAVATAWPEPEWSAVKLENHPVDDARLEDASAQPSDLEVAPMGLRLTAALVDCTLIALACLGAALGASARIGHPPAAKYVAVGIVAAYVLIGLLFHAFFLLLAADTPGMRSTGISLCTFDSQIPTRAQLRSRLSALLLSLIPMGLGLAWVLFDDDHLSWHDRLSKTYPRKR